jgi:prevent-host-death family protein
MSCWFINSLPSDTATSCVLIKSNDLVKLLEQLFREKHMQTYTANEAKTRFGEFLDRVQREPVQVMKHDRVVGVMVSAEDYLAMRAFYADRLRHNIAKAADGAAAAGMTEQKLNELLADES